jgi:hypothetical protein
MVLKRCWTAALAALGVAAALPLASTPAAAQETAIKGGISVTRLEQTGLDYWDDRLVSTTFGGHVRFRLGPLNVQPELHVMTKGAAASMPVDVDDDQIRMEYIELPVLLVVPFSVGPLEPYLMGGPALMLESRCRAFFRQDGLRTNVGCDPPRGPLFQRRAFDYGVVAAGGAAYPVLGGRVFVEARHTRGLRNIYAGQGQATAFHRTNAFHIGYAVGWAPQN